jgi:hypothetical protein
MSIVAENYTTNSGIPLGVAKKSIEDIYSPEDIASMKIEHKRIQDVLAQKIADAKAKGQKISFQQIPPFIVWVQSQGNNQQAAKKYGISMGKLYELKFEYSKDPQIDSATPKVSFDEWVQLKIKTSSTPNISETASTANTKPETKILGMTVKTATIVAFSLLFLMAGIYYYNQTKKIKK